jgi:hypothetical protein
MKKPLQNGWRKKLKKSKNENNAITFVEITRLLIIFFSYSSSWTFWKKPLSASIFSFQNWQAKDWGTISALSRGRGGEGFFPYLWLRNLNLLWGHFICGVCYYDQLVTSKYKYLQYELVIFQYMLCSYELFCLWNNKYYNFFALYMIFLIYIFSFLDAQKSLDTYLKY